MLANLPLLIRYLLTAGIGMVPIIELRGAIPVGVLTFKLSYLESFLCSFIGNIIPVYFIVKFIRPLFDFFGRWKIFKVIIDWATEKATKHIQENEKLQNAVSLGLFLFVAIPLPGSGAWTGCILASFLELDKKKSLIFAILGVLIASIIMMILSFGLLKGIIN